MKRSSQVVAPLLATTALALISGCHGPEMQRCVDPQNRVVDQSLCASGPRGGGGGYHAYYGGGGSYRVGSTVEGGSSEPVGGHSYSTSSGTARGGFGSSFSGEGGGHGGGEGGGHGGGGGGE